MRMIEARDVIRHFVREKHHRVVNVRHGWDGARRVQPLLRPDRAGHRQTPNVLHRTGTTDATGKPSAAVLKPSAVQTALVTTVILDPRGGPGKARVCSCVYSDVSVSP